MYRGTRCLLQKSGIDRSIEDEGRLQHEKRSLRVTATKSDLMDSRQLQENARTCVNLQTRGSTIGEALEQSVECAA